MSSEQILAHLRKFLLGFTIFLSAGTIVELLLAEHTGSTVQLIPFILSGLAIITALLVLIRPQRTTLRLLQLVMIVSMLGSLLGVYEHLEGNWEFAQEIQPSATMMTLTGKALSGANPLLAPGMLAFAAMIALAATYYHPVLRPSAMATEEVTTQEIHGRVGVHS